MCPSRVGFQKAAQNLKPVVPIKFRISSRTDTGVHALCNSAHLDIQRAPGKPVFSEKQLVYGLNYHLKPEPIRWVGGESKSFILPLLEKGGNAAMISHLHPQDIFSPVIRVGKPLPCTCVFLLLPDPWHIKDQSCSTIVVRRSSMLVPLKQELLWEIGVTM